jgi:hypothetical protein
MNKKKKEEIKVDPLKAAKEFRRKAWEDKQKESKNIENTRDEFRKFFIKIKSKLNLDKSMEEVLWVHFKSSGFDKKDKFQEGLKHFGYR